MAAIATAAPATEKPKQKRTLRPIVVPGKIVQVEKPEHNYACYAEYQTKPGDIVLVESVSDNGIIHVIDVMVRPKSMMKKGTKLTIVKKPEQAKFMEGLRGATKTISGTGVKYLTGFDPEVFAVDENGVVIPAFKFLPPKEKPIKFNAVSGNHQENHVFFDGFQAEFATAAPGHCHAYALDNIRKSLERIFVEARKFNPKAALTHKCVLDIPYEMMQECTPEQAGLGCSPSKNLYGENHHLDTLNPSELQFRFAGCHIHHNTSATKDAANELMVKMLDLIAGVCSVAILEGMEDERRRKFYGLAGEYRLPKHGLEYRVLSSALLAHPVLMIFFLDFTRQVVGNAHRLSLTWDGKEDEAQEVINTLDVPRSKKIIERNKNIIKAMMNGLYPVKPKVIRLFEEGAANVLPINDMEKSWRFGQIWHNHSNGPDCCVANCEAFM